IQECPKQPHDPAVTKLCEECGWAGPRESWPELPSSTDSSDEDSDLSEDEKDKEESEETKAKRLAANTPKVQVQLEGQEQQQPSSSSDNNGDTTTSPKRSCNGSCQTSKHDDPVDTPALAKVVDEIEHVQL
ncbi:hypothetical protein BGX34_000695, partial [Mortierella sp. NVP85]